MSQENFRVGGVYRNRLGAACHITAVAAQPGYGVVTLPDMDDYKMFGEWCLASGKWSQGDGHIDLIPGELHNVNGEWVPIEAQATTLADWLGTRQNSAPVQDPLPESISEALMDMIDPEQMVERKREPLPSLNCGSFDSFKGWEPVRSGGVVQFLCVDCEGCSKCTPSGKAYANPFVSFRYPDLV